MSQLRIFPTPSKKHDAVFSVDGYEVSATFAKTADSAAITHVRQMLLSAFVADTSKQKFKNILAISSEQEDNREGGSPLVP